MSKDDGFGEAWADLYYAADRALRKMQSEYQQRQQFASPDECWAEAEALQHALQRVEEVTGYAVRTP